MKRYILASALTCLALSLTGCSDVCNIGGGDALEKDSVVRFAIRGGAEAKGEIINTTGDNIDFSGKFSEFRVSAWNSDNSRFIPDRTSDGEYISGNATDGYYQKVQYRTKDVNGTALASPYWMTMQTMPSSVTASVSGPADDEYIWKKGETKTFFAYANLPASGASMKVNAGGQTLSYTNISAASAQKDILLGIYSGDGKSGSPATMTGTASIVFSHPLTAVAFKRGEIPEDVIVKSIALSGIAGSGKVTMGSTGLGAWTIDNYSGSSSQNNDSGLPVSGSVIGEPFLIIPQNTATGNVTVTFSFTSGESASAMIATDNWQAGKINTYKVNYSGIITIGALSVTPFVPFGESGFNVDF